MRKRGRHRVTSGVIQEALAKGDAVTVRLVDHAVWGLGIALSVDDDAGPRLGAADDPGDACEVEPRGGGGLQDPGWQRRTLPHSLTQLALRAVAWLAL